MFSLTQTLAEWKAQYEAASVHGSLPCDFLSEESVQDLNNRSGLTRPQLYDKIAVSLAVGFQKGELDFYFCDSIVNDIHSVITNNDEERSEIFWQVFQAFDEGEYFHNNDRSQDPVEIYTRPMIAQILSSVECDDDRCVSGKSTANSKFLTKVENWIQTNKEVFVLIRYSCSAGSKDFEFFSAFEGFQNRLHELKSRDNIIVFGQRQLGLRGTVDVSFIGRALESVPDGKEWIIVGTEKRSNPNYSFYAHSAGETHEELRESLNDFVDERVAFGLYPPWLEDNQYVISATIPEADGSVIVGIY